MVASVNNTPWQACIAFGVAGIAFLLVSAYLLLAVFRPKFRWYVPRTGARGGPVYHAGLALAFGGFGACFLYAGAGRFMPELPERLVSIFAVLCIGGVAAALI